MSTNSEILIEKHLIDTNQSGVSFDIQSTQLFFFLMTRVVGPNRVWYICFASYAVCVKTLCQRTITESNDKL